MGMKLVLDTNVILYHLANRLAAPLPPAFISASIISEMEALSYPTLTTIEEASIRQYIASLQLIELTTSIKEKAIRLRRQHRLKLPDAIIAATAQELDATLLTCDQQLLSLPVVTTQAPGLRNRS
ncbi:MAG: type II toxin-antitoxin system VapC family toxin [Candidatus Competibacteraceae bacterium]|nr:type II toxin-antitoxin system VapC family toxin [Candidatus Competibacteraceae bacterium]